ncbi:hypothetical protein [Oceanimonas smirnovii]|uniref:hypothetical protein n=1 Tax=Oceanimonas smirnovii TaxID=264574 RepID=UPI003FD5E983
MNTKRKRFERNAKGKKVRTLSRTEAWDSAVAEHQYALCISIFLLFIAGALAYDFFYHGGMVVSLGRRDDSWPVKLFIGTFVSLAVWGFLSTLMDIWQDFRRKVKQRRVMK